MIRFALCLLFVLCVSSVAVAQDQLALEDILLDENKQQQNIDPMSKVGCSELNPQCNFQGGCAACQGGSCRVPQQRQGFMRNRPMVRYVSSGCAGGACAAGAAGGVMLMRRGFVGRRRLFGGGRRRMFGRVFGRCRGC